MNILNLIKGLQKSVSTLSNMNVDLNSKINDLVSFLEKDVFVPNSLSESIKEILTQIIDVQKEILINYEALNIGVIPARISEISTNLDVQEKCIKEKSAYVDIIKFFMCLQSNDLEIQGYLEQHKRQLATYDCEQMSTEECELALGKYLFLKKTFEETDNKNKFSMLLEMKNLFETQIIYGINSNIIIYVDSTEEIQEIACTSEIHLTSTELSNNMDMDLEEVTITAEENKENEETVIEFDKMTTMWQDIGIVDEKNIIVNMDNTDLVYYESKKSKKFGVKDFKNDLSKVGVEFSKSALIAAKDYKGLTSEFLSNLTDKESEFCVMICEKLTQLGYFNKYILLEYGEFYVLSSKGIKVFTTKESAAFLGFFQMRADSFEEQEYTANSAIAKIIFFHTFASIKSIVSSYKLNKNLVYFSNDGFIQCFTNVFSNDCVLGYISLISSSVEEFENLKNELSKSIETIDMIIIIGMNTIHSKEIATWIYTNFKEKLSNRKLWYMNYGTEVYYDYLDNSIIDIAEFLEQNVEELSCDTKEVLDDDNLIIVDKIKVPDVITSNVEDVEDNIDVIIEENVNDIPVAPVKNTKESLSDSMRKHIIELSLQMLISEKYYCATAYLKALSAKYPEYEQEYRQLAYALNDPLAECNYSSEYIFTVYFSESDSIIEQGYYVLSAVLRNYFLDQCRYDYKLQQLQGAIAGMPILEENMLLNQVIYTLQSFKSNFGCGMDFYADYRQRKREAFEKTLTRICYEASMLYDNNVHGIIKEKKSHKRVLETRKLIFAKDSDLITCLEAVKDDNRDFLKIIEEFLLETYIKAGSEIHVDNIDPGKIDMFLDYHWDLAGQKMDNAKTTSTLMSSLRRNLFNLIKRVVIVLCDYVSIIGTRTIDEDDPGLIEYKRTREILMENITGAIAYFRENLSRDDIKSMAGQSVICNTLYEILDRLAGSYEEDSNRYFYLGFLGSDKVLLDEDYLPVLDDIHEIKKLSIFSRIEEHFQTPEKNLEIRFQEIIAGGDDYGSAFLILQYFRNNSDIVKDKRILQSSIEEASSYPRKDMENKRREFIEDLELAQSYGQIDNTVEDRKETLVQIMDVWYAWALETQNYGFFYKILSAIREKIKEEAQTRTIDLEASLGVYQNEHPDWEQDDRISNAVHQIQSRIETQNYAAAEDLLNRLIANDLEVDINIVQNDYLYDFLKEYMSNSTQAGNASATLKSRFSKGHGYNKDARGANRLIDNWPKRNGTSPAVIRELLLAFGFNVEEVVSQPNIQGKDHYQVTLQRPSNGRKSNYKHPIPVFGSEAEEKGFRVVNIFGKMDAGRLIDTFKEIGTAKTTMILLDYTLTLPDRRELARKTKTEFNGKTFIVVDRVVLVYLANHYSETAINRMLMAVTMPFASYQPYVSDSAKIMPPEIFMGRRNELEKIESASGVNIVYGGRQLGKSALLRMAQKDINFDENGDRAILVDIKGLDYKRAAKKISATLYDEGVLKKENVTEEWDEIARDIKNRLRDTNKEDYIPYLLLLIDEADVFIESCETVGYRPFDALKDIQSVGAGRFKFVVAGLRNIVRFKKNIALSNNSVLTHLSSLTVTPFKSIEARELLEVPLSYLGFRFSDDSNTEMLISTIFGTTNYFPGLIQLYCSKLIEAMQRDYAGYAERETPPYVVKEEHIKKVLSDKNLEQQIREKFFITLKVDEDDYYYLIALLVAFHYHNNKGQRGCSAKDIRDIALGYSIMKISMLNCEKIRALMEEMRELNVLQQVGNGRYRFARHSFCQMMGSKQRIDDQILDYAINQEEEYGTNLVETGYQS